MKSMRVNFVLMLAAMLPPKGVAQNVADANLCGIVKDVNGSAVAGATVTISDTGRDFSRSVPSGAGGGV